MLPQYERGAGSDDAYSISSFSHSVMALETGGYADKLGNRFETLWVVLQYLQLLAGELVSVYHEPVGDDEDGVDLWVMHRNGDREAQQCKAELGIKNAWTMADLNEKGILESIRTQLQRDDVHRFALVSATPATMLRDLSRSARDSTGDPKSFYRDQIQARSTAHRDGFADFCKYLSLEPADADDLAVAFNLLRRSGFHPFADDADTQRLLTTLAGLVVDGDSGGILASLAEFSSNNLRKTIYADNLLTHLRSKGFHPKDLVRDKRLQPSIEELRRQFDGSIRHNLAGSRLIPRSETQSLLTWLKAEKDLTPLLLLHGRAGTGKSGVLLEVLDYLEANDIPYLPLRLDRQIPYGNARKSGDLLGLPDSAVACLRAIAGERPSVLIIDQLDALRWTSALAASALPICEEMLRQAMATRSMRVIVTCRTFDLAQDPQLKAWNNKKALSIEVGPLTKQSVRAFVLSCGHRYDDLTPREAVLLSSIHNLTMWAGVARGSDMPRFRTATHLTRQFWQSRQVALSERQVEWDDAEKVLLALSNHMDTTGELSAPERLVEMHSRQLSELQSLNVIQTEAGRVSFCHQAHFDYLIARSLLREIDLDPRSLMNWLGIPPRSRFKRFICSLTKWLPFRPKGSRHRQSLFRREQLRLVLALLRDEEPERFLSTLKALITDQQVRFHMKHLALQVLAQVIDPEASEVDCAITLLQDEAWRAHFIEQLVHADRSWFLALYRQGLWSRWLASGDDDLVNHAFWALRLSNTKCGEEVAILLRPYVVAGGPWLERCLRSLPRTAEEESDALFKLRLGLCELGVFDHWVDWEGYVRRRPEGCVYLLAAYLKQALREVHVDDSGRRRVLESLYRVRDSKQSGVARIGKLHPEIVWKNLFPCVKQLINRRRKRKMRYKRKKVAVPANWTYRTSARVPPIIRALLIESGKALVRSDPKGFFRTVAEIGERSSRSIESILLKSLLGADEAHADDVVRWLIARPSRFRVGKRPSPSQWEPARRLIHKFAPHCSTSVYEDLERSILSYHDQEERDSIQWKYEQAKHGSFSLNLYGQTQHHLLPALPDVRKSVQARSLQGVLERKFAMEAERLWPKDRGTRAGNVRSSIPRERLQRMSDGAWLRLVSKALSRRRLFDRECADGAFAESSVEMFARDLEYMARCQPSRFARLAMDIPAEVDTTYVEHILIGLQSSSPPDDLSAEVKEQWSPANANELEVVLRRVHLDLANEHAVTFCRLLQRHAEAEWSSDSVRRVVSIAQTHEHPKPGHSVEHGGNREPSETLEANSMNVTRGVAAGTIESLLWRHPGWLDRVAPAIEAAVNDPHPAVRAAGIGACLPVLNIDLNQAVAWLIHACAHDDTRILACRKTRQMLTYLSRSHLTKIEPIIERMLASEITEVQKWGAAQTTGCWLVHNKMQRQFKRCQRGTEFMRIGCATTACDLGHDPRFAQACRDVLEPYFSDPHDEVRQQCNRLFLDHRMSCVDWGPKFLTTYVGTAAFQDDPSALLHALEAYTGSLVPLASVVFAVCNSFAGPLAGPSRDIATSTAGDARQIAPILLRLYEQSEGIAYNAIQERCLDAWDALLANRVGSVSTMIDEFAA